MVKSLLSLFVSVVLIAMSLLAFASCNSSEQEVQTDSETSADTQESAEETESIRSSETEEQDLVGIGIPTFEGASYTVQTDESGRSVFELFAPAEDQNGKVVSKVWFPFRSEGHTLIVLRQDAETWWHIAIWTEHYVQLEDGDKFLLASVREVHVLKSADQDGKYSYPDSGYSASHGVRVQEKVQEKGLEELRAEHIHSFINLSKVAEFFRLHMNKDITGGPVYILYDSDSGSEPFLQTVESVPEFDFRIVREAGFLIDLD